jgi:hypothetical protein
MTFHAFFAVIRFPYEISCFLAAYLSYAISCVGAVTRIPFEISCFLSLMRFHEMSL